MNKTLLACAAVVAFSGTCFAGGNDGITIKLCGAFEQPGTYSVNRKSVHIQDILTKTQPILLARTDLALVVDGDEQRTVDLSVRGEESLLRGGEQVYLFERIMGRNSR